MKSYSKMLQVTSYIGGSLLTIGIVIFLYGAFVSNLTTTIGIGIGTVMGAVFVFIMGIFLVVTEEMITNSRQCKKEIV